jgi:hypothetical protein
MHGEKGARNGSLCPGNELLCCRIPPSLMAEFVGSLEEFSGLNGTCGPFSTANISRSLIWVTVPGEPTKLGTIKSRSLLLFDGVVDYPRFLPVMPQ